MCLFVSNLLQHPTHPNFAYICIFQSRSLIPAQQIEILGCIIDSVRMIAYYSTEKVKKVTDLCAAFLKNDTCTIRTLAQILGNFVASYIIFENAPLHYKRSEIFSFLKDDC